MNFELWKAWPRIYWALGQLDTKIMATKPNIFFEVGEIRPAQESDFEHFIGLADGGGWTKKMEKHGLLVWTRNTENSFVKMFKLHTVFEDISAAIVFDVIMDQDYRPTWDDASIRDFDICKLDGYNDIGYYAMKCPAPLKNRDYVNQRSWKVVLGQQYVVFNHSVSHEQYPPLKNFIRAVSYVTGFLLRPHGEGCSLTYITQSDPKGKIPKWVINFALSKVAPKLIERLHTACIKYSVWKSSNKSDFKPWLHPEQNPLPLYSGGDEAAPRDIANEREEEHDSQALDRVPEGMDVYQTMGLDEELVATDNGVSNGSS